MDKRNDVLSLISKLREDTVDADTKATILDDLSDKVSAAYDNLDSLNTANGELIRNNEKLRNANMELFLQIGSEPQKPAPIETPEPEPRVPFADLFNEKGELK